VLELDSEDVKALGRQAAKSKLTQDKIINAVVALIKENGFASASSAKIAKRAGVTWGAVQHHFGAKEDILEEILSRSHRKFEATMSAKRFSQGTSERRVAKYVDAAWYHYQGDEYMATMEILLATRGHGNASNDLSITRSRQAHLDMARRIFHDSKVSDAVLSEAIYLVHCLLTGLLIEIAIEPESFAPKNYLKRLKAMVFQMLYTAP